jgi:hypothetical protein
MCYDAYGIGKRSQGIVNPIIVEHNVKHEGLGFGGEEKVGGRKSSFKMLAQDNTTKITFVK